MQWRFHAGWAPCGDCMAGLSIIKLCECSATLQHTIQQAFVHCKSVCGAVEHVTCHLYKLRVLSYTAIGPAAQCTEAPQQHGLPLYSTMLTASCLYALNVWTDSAQTCL
jgi:hypothetical protein